MANKCALEGNNFSIVEILHLTEENGSQTVAAVFVEGTHC
jgi:hypothetical protein